MGAEYKAFCASIKRVSDQKSHHFMGAQYENFCATKMSHTEMPLSTGIENGMTQIPTVTDSLHGAFTHTG